MSKFIIGIDDAGRGALAGPIVYAGVYHKNPQRLIELGARDSKETDAADRREFYQKLIQEEEDDLKFKVVVVEPEMVNNAGYTLCEGIAVHQIAVTAFRALKRPIDEVYLRLDGLTKVNQLSDWPHVEYIAQGDRYDPCIAAASILAKYHHDRHMELLHKQYPDWEFLSHRGYSTKAHHQKLYDRGPLPIHRSRPVKTAMNTYLKKTGLIEPSWMIGV